MNDLLRWGCCLMAGVGLSCVDYTPKPRGYVRIEPEEATYAPFDVPSLPFRFALSRAVTVEWPEKAARQPMFNLVYPVLGARIYCSYLPISRATFPEVESESRRLVARSSTLPAGRIREQAYLHPEESVFGSLFLLDGGDASPIRFMLTDSVSHFFRGALYFDCHPNADSLAPAIDYVRHDVVELMQTFQWR